MNTDQLMRKAAQYKKLLEQYTLNPFAYVINGNEYYLVNYHTNDPNKFKGYAVISLDSGPSEEYRAALLPLTLFSGASANIFNIMEPRSKIHPDFYKHTIEAIENEVSSSGDVSTSDPIVKGKSLFEKLMRVQTDFNQIYNKYEKYYDNEILVKHVIGDKDIDDTLTALSKLDLLQFQQGVLLSEYEEILPAFFQAVEKRNFKSKLPRESWKFLMGMKDNLHILDDRVAQFKFEQSIKHLPFDEQIRHKIEDTTNSGKQLIKEREKRLRGPAAK
ncbi:hypothetical protein [Lederbergia citrea]|uniref:Uncharacterized protein n=1 Tax=Lederbergia citrea TaxID=2833581 RepID=A0A942UUD9_9BACI|nr:hypothetical protein [Lederbergia citrea]MBS4179494.1 hypothetical protein [Lederbergia citrea]MBS4224903.1 hypothetical protein [Lederbergia citrea]